MVNSTVLVSALVLTEDSGDGAEACIAAVTKRMLQVIEPRAATHRVEFIPADQDCRVVKGNMFRGVRAKGIGRHQRSRELTDLVRAIATKVSEEGVVPIVLVHIDGDTSWADRELSRAYSDIEDLTRRVRDLLMHGGPRTKGVDAAEAEQRIRRICALIPHYSVEAWVFQNFSVLSTLIPSQERAFRRRLATWKEDRGLLDEIPQIKEVAPIGSKHNKTLAETQYPAQEVHAVCKSFHAGVEGLRSVPGLVDALERSYTDLV